MLDDGRGDLGELGRGILQRVQKTGQVSDNLDIALGRGGLDVDFYVGQELGDVLGELPVQDEEAGPFFGDLNFDVGQGELGDLLAVADNFLNPLPVKVIVNVPAFFDFEDAGHVDKMWTIIRESLLKSI